MSIIQAFEKLSQYPVNRRQALISLSLLALTACSRLPKESKASGGNVAYYTCSMHPSVHSPVPGKCPICGMDLIPVASAANGSKDSVYVAPDKLRELGAAVVAVQTTPINGVPGLVVPAAAVLPTGNQYLVFIDLGSGYLAPREIRIGARGPDRYQVLSGLREGDHVISGALFLIDAECRNQGVLTTWGDNS